MLEKKSFKGKSIDLMETHKISWIYFSSISPGNFAANHGGKLKVSVLIYKHCTMFRAEIGKILHFIVI